MTYTFKGVTPIQRARQIRILRAKESVKIALRKAQKEGLISYLDSIGLPKDGLRCSKLVYSGLFGCKRTLSHE